MNRLLIGAGNQIDLLVTLFHEDLQNDHSAILILDPSGKFARRAADTLPARYTERAIYFDPSDLAHSAGFNILANVLPDDHQRVTEQLCAFIDTALPGGESTLSRLNARFIL